MRFGKYRSNEKILHDEYFSDQPSAAFLLTARLVLLCLMSASFVMIFCDLYGYEGVGFLPAGIAAAASGAVFILASLFPAPLIYGTVFAALAGVIWVLRDKVILLSTYLWDWLMVKLDSRLLHTAEYMIHTPSRIIDANTADTAILHSAFFWAAILLAVICAVLFTSAVRTRFRFIVPALAVTLISAPAVAAEIAAFLPSYIAFVVCVFGFQAISSSYDLDCGFIYGRVTSARLSLLREDHEYHKRTRFVVLGKRIKNDTQRFHRYSGNMIAMTVIAALVFSGASWLVPDGKGINLQQVWDTVSSIATEAANTIGDIFGITLGKADDRGYFSSDNYGEVSGSISLAPPSDSDRPVLEVTLSRDDIPVYLRGDIGVDYIGGAWTSISTVADKYRSFVGSDFCPESEYQVFRRYLAWMDIDPEDVMPLQMVSLKYIRNTRVVFQPAAPFELSYKESDIYDYFGDFILRTRNGFVKTFDSLALTPAMESGFFGTEIAGTAGSGFVFSSLTNGTITAPDMSAEYYIRNITAYRAFIDETYKRAPAEPMIDPICQDVLTRLGGVQPDDNAGRYRISRGICEYFKENFTYSLDPPKTVPDAGENKDMLDTFLNETHSGHCALFATAMTLALREFGIPARYVTGYVTEPGGEQDENGYYRQTLTERQLHAWVEVYFRGIGWLPFDPTAEVPGYADSAVVPAEPEVTTDVTSDTTAGTTAPEPPEDTSDADTTAPPDDVPASPATAPDSQTEPTKTGDSLWVRLLPIIVIMVIIIALAVVTILFFHNLSAAEKRTIKSFRSLPPTEATVLMYRFTMTLLSMKGLIPGNEQFYDFAERVDGSIELKGLNYFLMDVMPTFEKAEFGDPKTSPVSEDEREAVYRYTAAVYAKVMSDASSMKRLSMKMSLFL